MSTTTIGGMTAGTAGNLTGAALLEMEDSASASVRFSAATLRTQMLAGGTGFTATDPLVAGGAAFSGDVTTSTTTVAGYNFYNTNFRISVTQATGLMEFKTNNVVGFSLTNGGVGANVTGTLTVGGLLLTVASATGGAGLRIPHGAAPTSPTNGDMWTTTAGAFIRINGVTKTFTLT